mgnify:CR=1 FL=1
MANEYMKPISTQNIDRSTAYANQMALVGERIQAFLGSRAKTCVLPLTPASVQAGVPEFDSKQVGKGADKTHEYTHNEFTADQLIDLGMVIMDLREDPCTPVALRNEIPVYWNTRKHMAELFSLEYTPSKGNNAGIVRSGAFHILGNYRRALKRYHKRNQLTETLSKGEAFFAEGVVGKDGTAIPYKNEKKAQKAWARHKYGQDWWLVNKDDRLEEAKAFVYAQGQTLGKEGQQAVGQHALTVLEGKHHSTIKRVAREMGASKSESATKAKALLYITENISKLSPSMLE